MFRKAVLAILREKLTMCTSRTTLQMFRYGLIARRRLNSFFDSPASCCFRRLDKQRIMIPCGFPNEEARDNKACWVANK